MENQRGSGVGSDTLGLDISLSSYYAVFLFTDFLVFVAAWSLYAYWKDVMPPPKIGSVMMP